MVGVTLVEIREHIAALARDDGDYGLICARTGERPFPVAGKRFPDRATAAAAARATEQYRAALRRYDPRLPAHDVIVREETEPISVDHGAADSEGESAAWSLRDPIVTGEGRAGPTADRIEFCHSVAGAVFETLSTRGHETVESAVMDAYLDLAETVTDPDELCLCLLECMAGELQAGLTPTAQAAVCAGAAERLPPAGGTAAPVRATFASLQRLGLVGTYRRLPAAVDLATRSRAVEVTVADYALSPRDGRLPVLPIVVDLYRRQPRWPPTALGARRADDGWRVRIALGRERDHGSLTSVRIDGE